MVGVEVLSPPPVAARIANRTKGARAASEIHQVVFDPHPPACLRTGCNPIQTDRRSRTIHGDVVVCRSASRVPDFVCRVSVKLGNSRREIIQRLVSAISRA
jgi:hypothetical protein